MLEKYLLKSLKTQSNDCDLILVDNTDGKYYSAAAALNYGASMAQGEYIMFIHQDVDLCTPHWLEEVESNINELEDLGVLGVAGKATNIQSAISNIYQGDPPEKINPDPIKRPVKVQTIDECLFIIPRPLFEEIKFDQEVCDDWHLYGVDFCLTAKKKGYQVFVSPQCVYHRSPGDSFSEGYYETLGKLIQKHKKHYRFINTTMGEWFTFYPLNLQRKYPELKNKLIHGLRMVKML
jgi:GT2 family glycosyltransferase